MATVPLFDTDEIVIPPFVGLVKFWSGGAAMSFLSALCASSGMPMVASELSQLCLVYNTALGFAVLR